MTEEDANWKPLMARAAVCLGLLLAAILMEKLTGAGRALIVSTYLAAMIVGGWSTAIETWESFRRKEIDIHFLMLAVAVGSAIIGAWQEGALLLFLFALGGALEHYAFARMNGEISALHHAAPKTARVIDYEGNEHEVEVDDLKAGDRLVVRPDETFPADAMVLEGETEVDESMLTGEAVPVAKVVNDSVSSGTLNLWGKVTLKILRPAEESSLARIIHMIQTAQESKAPSQRFTDRFGSKYTIGVLAAAVIVFLLWWLVFKNPPSTSVYRAISFLVVASPCALVLSIPSAILAGIAWGAKHGVLFRGGRAIEELAGIDTIALDKTGTLTAGNLRVLKVITYPPGKEDEMLEVALTVEEASNHPIARAITRHCRERGVSTRSMSHLHSLTGLGIKADLEDGTYLIGRSRLLEDDPRFGDLDIGEPQSTEVWIAGPELLGRITLQDEVRIESKPVLEDFRSRGITTLMLTGDQPSAAEPIARELGISQVHAGLHPDDKVNLIVKLMEKGHRVAMVGDGVNDAPALAAAHVSVSMGGRGSDAALEQSDVVLVNDRIERLGSALVLSRRARAVIGQNLVIALGTVVVMVLATLLSTVPLSLAVVVHESSTVLVCLNSLRLLFFKDGSKA